MLDDTGDHRTMSCLLLLLSAPPIAPCAFEVIV
jgi:hypothetical protein